MACSTDKFTKQSYVRLSTGQKMPLIGLGTSKGDRGKVTTSVKEALNAGYRLIDTATFYANEAQIGEALQEAIAEKTVTRDEVFVITKLPPAGMHANRVEQFLRASLAKLRLDYVDTYLIHEPFGVEFVSDDVMLPFDENKRVRIDVTTDLVAIWKKMEKMVDLGLTKSIGVSNFNREQIQRIINTCRFPPVCNQIELHAYYQRPLLAEFCNDRRIVVMAYAPLASPGYGTFLKNIFKAEPNDLPNLFEDSTLLLLSKKYNKSIPQIMIRWCVQRGFVPIPKSETAHRIQENLEIFDFHLLDEDILLINGLDRDLRIFVLNHHPGLTDHPEYIASQQD